jgi:hypothetical protein
MIGFATAKNVFSSKVCCGLFGKRSFIPDAREPNNHTVPYGTDLFIRIHPGSSCQDFGELSRVATFIPAPTGRVNYGRSFHFSTVVISPVTA